MRSATARMPAAFGCAGNGLPGTGMNIRDGLVVHGVRGFCVVLLWRLLWRRRS